jgi:hypothetical protein
MVLVNTFENHVLEKGKLSNEKNNTAFSLPVDLDISSMQSGRRKSCRPFGGL